MINDNKVDFMNAVSMKAEEFRAKSYEACLEGMMKSVIKESLTVDVPKQCSDDDKKVIANEVKATINSAAKEIANNAVNNDYDKSFNVDIAKEIVNPKNFCESIQQVVAESIFKESEDRAKVLDAQFSAGRFNGATSEEVYDYVVNAFSNESFDSRFDNGVTLKKNINLLLSTEGEDVVNDIKNEVAEMVNETEAKNSVIREAVSEVNDTKAKIEERINGESDDEKKDDGDEEKSEEPTESDELEEPSTDDIPEEPSDDTSTEGWYNKAVKNKKVFSSEDLYQIFTTGGASKAMSTEEFNVGFDKDSFSREEADTILKAFQEIDGIDSEAGDDIPEVLSTSDADGAPESADGSMTEGEASAEHDYSDDENRYEMTTHVEDIEPSKLDGDEDDMSEESMARDFMPLSFKKSYNQNISINHGKMAAYLALTPDHGSSFFENVQNRRITMANMLSKEDAICDNIAKDDIEKKLDSTIEKCNDLHNSTDTLTENLGIIGILDGDYQRTESHVQNAINSLFKPEVIAPMGKDLSKEELYEHELADIFKLALKLADVESDIANGVDVLGNKDQLGYIDELLNEKMYMIEPDDKFEVDTKVKALQSIESIVPIEEIANMQVFMFAPEEKRDKIKLNSIKDIDAYGYSYIDEIEKIKDSVKSKYKDYTTGAKHAYNLDIDSLVESVVEEMDTTKLTSNLYEKVISKLVEDKDISSSIEGLTIRNKAKTITTSYVAGSKLGLLNDGDVRDIRNHLSV